MTPTAPAEERPPAPLATVLLVLLVLAATAAIAYFAFGSPSGRAQDTVRYEGSQLAGENGVSAARGQQRP